MISLVSYGVVQSLNDIVRDEIFSDPEYSTSDARDIDRALTKLVNQHTCLLEILFEKNIISINDLQTILDRRGLEVITHTQP